jgi:tetratricopeptide (TPR) repeat protein
MIRYLSQGTQQLLHIAAILGPKFSKSLLEAMWARQDDFETCLVELEARQWFQTLPGEAERTYVFTHVFMQEAVYASLSITDRQRLHTAASRILESLPRTQETVNMLAYHYTRSEQWYQAIASLTHLAELAVGYGAYKEALVRLREADRDVEHLHMAQRPHCRLELIIKQAQILLALGRFDEVLALFRQQEPLLNQTQDHRLHSRFLFLCSQTQSALGNWSQAAQHAQRAVALATQLEDVTILGQAASIWAMERYWAGHLVNGAELSQRAITALQGRQEPTALGMAYLVLALNTLVLGDFSKTLYATNQARSLAAVSEDAHMQSFADWVEGWAQATYGEWEAAITQCQCSLDYAPDPLSSALAMGWLGYAHLEKGNAMEAMARLEEAVQGLHQFAYHRLEGLFLSFLAAAHLACHDINKAHHLAQQSLSIVSEQGYRFGIGSAQRMLGKLAHAANAPDTAEVHLKNALTTFEDMQARFEVGRTHLDLAALAQLQDRRGVARIHCTTALKQFSDLQVPRYIELAQNHYGDL